MNKEQFLQALSSELAILRKEEVKEIIADYEEHFSFALEEGKTEEEVTASLGSPQTIAKEILTTYQVKYGQKVGTTGNVFRAVWAVIGLSFFNLVIVLGPFIALISLVLSGWGISIGFIVAPVLVILNVLLGYSDIFLFELFSSITLCGLGLLLWFGMLYVSKVVLHWIARYWKFNIALVKGGLK